MSGSSSGGKPRIKSIFDSDDESDEEKSPVFVITQSTSEKKTSLSKSSSNVGLTIVVPKTVKTSDPSSATHVQVKLTSPPKIVNTSDISSAAPVQDKSSNPKIVRTSDPSTKVHVQVKSSSSKTVTSDTSAAASTQVKSSPPIIVRTSDPSAEAYVQVKSITSKTVTSETSVAAHLQLKSSPPKMVTTSDPLDEASVQVKSNPPKIITTSDPSAETHGQVKLSPPKIVSSNTLAAAPAQVKSSPPKPVTTSNSSAEASLQVDSKPPKIDTTSDPSAVAHVKVKTSPSKSVTASVPSAAAHIQVISSPPKIVASDLSPVAHVKAKSSPSKTVTPSEISAEDHVKVKISPSKTVTTSEPSAAAHVQVISSPPKTVASDVSAAPPVKAKSIPTKTVITSDPLAEAHVQFKTSSSPSTSRVAASSTAALFARLRKTPPTEIKKSNFENKESCFSQKDEISKESLFKVSSTKVQTISENKDTRDANILKIRKLDERPKGPKKDLLDKFIHMNDGKIEQNTLQPISELTIQKEPTRTTDVSINKQNTSVCIEREPEKDKLEPQAISPGISPVDTKEINKFKEDLLNEQTETFGKKEESRKREGSPIVTSRAEKGAKYDIKTAIEIKSKISQISMSSVEHLESSQNSNIATKSSANNEIFNKGEGNSKVTFKASTEKSELTPKIILKSSLSPKLISSEKDSPKLILKTSSPGSLDKSIERSKYTKTIESPESTNIYEPISKVTSKSSEFSESFGNIDKSPKFTVKKISSNELSRSKEGSPNLSLQTEFTSKMSSSAGGSPKLILKSVTNTSKDSSKPTEGIPKFIIKSTQASESSSVAGTSHKISFKNFDTVESAANVKSIPKLILKSTLNAEKNEMSLKQEHQRKENKDKATIAPYLSKTTDDIEKEAKLSEKKMTYPVSPVSSNLPSGKSPYAHEDNQNISQIKEYSQSDFDDDNDDDNVEDDNDEEEKDYNDYGDAKRKYFKESMETPCIQDYSGSKVKTDNEKLQTSDERLSNPENSSSVDTNLKTNTKILVPEAAKMSSFELKSEVFKKLNMSPKFTCVKKDNSENISKMDYSYKKTLEVERSPKEIAIPSRVGKLCIKLKIPKPKELASQSNKEADLIKTFKENEKKQFVVEPLKVELHRKSKEDLQSEKVNDNNDKEKYILAKSKEQEIYDSDSDDVDDLDESKNRIDETGDDRTSDVNTTLTSNVDDPGSSDEDSSSDDSSDSESDVTANSTLESITDKDNDSTVKDSKKVSQEFTTVIDSDKFKEDFINKIEKTSSPVRSNVQENEDEEVKKDIEKDKKNEQNYEKGKEIKNNETCEKNEQNNEKSEDIKHDETVEEEAKIDEVNYDYDDLNKDYEEDSDESRMEIVEEETYETNEKKMDENIFEDVKMDKKNKIKGEVTVTKLKDKSRDNTTSDIDIETVYRRELDSSSKSGFDNITSTPKNDQSLKKVRVEDVFTDTEDEEDDDSEVVVIDSRGNSDTESINPIEQNSSSSYISTENKDISEENSAVMKSRKTRPKPRTEVDIDAVMKAFQRGWKREIVYRNQAEDGKRNRMDIYYYSPEGKKLRSRVEIESHLLRTGVTDLTRYNFTWLREPLGIDEKYEIVRYATKVTLSATKRGRPKTESQTPDPASKKARMKELRMVVDSPLVVSNPTSETRIPIAPSTKTTVHQLPGHKNISFRTVSKATPPKKKPQPPVPTGVHPSTIASAVTYSSYMQKNKLKQKQQLQYQPVETVPIKGNANPNNRNQVVYTSSICSRQPPTPRIITPLLGRSERCRGFHCTPLCPLGGGNVPSLSCVKCLCLFHPDCCYLPHAALHLIQSGATKFLCPNCFGENKENVNSEYEPGLCLGSEPLTYDPTDSEESDEEMPATDIDTSKYTRVKLIPECPPTPPRSPPPSEEDIQARTAAALNSQWIKSSHAHSNLHSQDPSYGIPMNIPMHPNLPGQQGNSQIPSHAALVGNLPGGGQLLQVQQNNATGQRFLLLRASDPQVASQGARSNMPTKIFLPTMFPGSQTMPLVLPQNVSPGQNLSVGLGTTPQKIMPTKWTQTGPLPKPKPPITPPFMSTMGANYNIMLRIFSYLHIKDLLVASQVSVMWRDLAFSPRLWNHVRLRNICVSNWQLLARFMDRRGTQSVDLRKMRMKIIRPIPIQKPVKESEIKESSVSSTNDQSRELDQDKHNKSEKEKSENDSKIDEEKIEIKNEVMEVEENSAETKNDNISDLNVHESEGKEKDPERKLSTVEGANAVEEEKSAVVSKSNIISNEDNKENPENIKDKEMKSDDLSSPLIIKSNKDVGALDQWLEICRCLGNIERLRALTLPSCQAEMVHQVLQNCHDLTSLTATDIRSNKQNPQLPVFDPSFLMEAPELAELRLASNKGFSFTCNFNFIKLQKLKVLVVRGLTETIWPYLGTNLTSLHIGPLRNFTTSNWANIGAMKSLEALWLEDGGNLQDIRVYEALHQLTNLKRLCLFNFVVGPRLYLALKKMTKLQKAFVLPSKEIDALITQNGHMLSVAENTKQVTELVWAIWADEVMDKDGTDSILICPSKIHLKLEGSKRPQEATEIWSFSKLHSVASKNLPRTTFRIMKLEPSTATLMALSTL